MKCPHCGFEIKNTEAAKAMGREGGKKSRRDITPEQQAKMQEAKKAKK